MRRDWADGERRLAAARARDPARAAAYDRVVAELRRTLRRRTGRRYSMRDLAQVYSRSAGWARDVAQVAAPGAAYAHDLGHRRRGLRRSCTQASDWTP